MPRQKTKKVKIELTLPEWCDERHIYIMAGVELAAYKDHGTDKWFVKTGRCVMCGKCCLNLPNPPSGKGQYPVNEKGNCVHLIESETGEQQPCKLGAMRPFPCCTGDPEKDRWNDGFCSSRYEEVK